MFPSDVLICCNLGDLILRKGRSIDHQYQKGLVYKIPCLQCDVAYIGQTKKSIKTRNVQHEGLCRSALKQKVLKSSKKDNGLALYVHQTGHKFDFENTEIIAGTLTIGASEEIDIGRH